MYQSFCFVVGRCLRLYDVYFIICQGFTPPVLVFVQSKERAKELFQELIYDGYNVDVIHADKTQTQVSKTKKQLKGKIWRKTKLYASMYWSKSPNLPIILWVMVTDYQETIGWFECWIIFWD